MGSKEYAKPTNLCGEVQHVGEAAGVEQARQEGPVSQVTIGNVHVIGQGRRLPRPLQGHRVVVVEVVQPQHACTINHSRLPRLPETRLPVEGYQKRGSHRRGYLGRMMATREQRWLGQTSCHQQIAAQCYRANYSAPGRGGVSDSAGKVPSTMSQHANAMAPRPDKNFLLDSSLS